MVTIRLKATLTSSGHLDFDLPQDLPDEDFELILDVAHNETPSEESTISEYTRPEPLTGAEIVAQGLTGGWEHMGIEDSVAWLEEQKRKRRERHKWPRD